MAIPFHKVHIIHCAGGERGGCSFTVEAPRRDLAGAVRAMEAHAQDTNHKPLLARIFRTHRIVEGEP